MNEVMQLLKGHRSIRRFTRKPISETVVQQLIACGQHAPSSSFFQAYSVIRVKNKEHRKKLAAWCGDQAHVVQAPLFLVFCGDMKRLQLACQLQEVEMKTGLTELLLIACVDTAIFAQNVMTASESLGLGGVYVGGIRNQPGEVSELLRLPAQVFPLFGMALGYPDQKPQLKPRLPVSLVLMEEYYHQQEKDLQQYDQTFQDYLRKRSHNARNETWTGTVSRKLKQELRPHMKSFLAEKGFGLE